MVPLRTNSKKIVVVCIIFCIMVLILLGGEIIKIWETNSLVRKPSKHLIEDYMIRAALKTGSGRAGGERDRGFYPDTTPVPTCQDKANTTAVVFQYRQLIHKLAKFHVTGKLPVIPHEDVCLLSEDILKDDKLQQMAYRVHKMRQNCRFKKVDDELDVTPDYDDDLKILHDSRHHFSLCLNAKAATTSLHKYGQALGVFDIVDHYLEQLQMKRGRHKLKDITHPPLLHHEDTRREQDLNTVLVRHPFRRTYSCYSNKVYTNLMYKKQFRFREIYARMLKFSSLPPGESVKKILQEVEAAGRGEEEFQIKTFTCEGRIRTVPEDAPAGNFTTTFNGDGEMVPTFRGFVLAVIASFLPCRGDPACIGDFDRHIKSQVMRCSPCNSNFDAVLKVSGNGEKFHQMCPSCSDAFERQSKE